MKHKISAMLLLALIVALPAFGQICYTTADMPASDKSSLEAAAQRYLQDVTSGNVAALQQNAISSLASNFAQVSADITDAASNVSGAQGTLQKEFLLDASEEEKPLPQAGFYCGVFGKGGHTANSAGFTLRDLSPAKYAIAIYEVSGGKKGYHVSFFMQQQSSAWKLAWVYIRPTSVAGHDAQWYLTQARQYAAKKQMHNAWFYYSTAIDLIAPVPFMSSLELEKIYSEQQAVMPADLPLQKPIAITYKGKTYNISRIYVYPEATGLDLVVRFQVPDLSDQAKIYGETLEVANAIVNEHPEYRDAFKGVVARATTATGEDFGGPLLAMNQIK